MKLREVKYDDDGEPEVLTVQVAPKELALIYGFFGHISPQAVTDVSDIEWARLAADVAADVGDIGDRFYDDGWDAPPFGRLLASAALEVKR
jgi:hypothetical protein